MTNEERALHGMVYQLEVAWNAADGAAFAALFADDADFDSHPRRLLHRARGDSKPDIA